MKNKPFVSCSLEMNLSLPKVAKIYHAAGRRYSKRVPVEDLVNNRHPS